MIEPLLFLLLSIEPVDGFYWDETAAWELAKVKGKPLVVWVNIYPRRQGLEDYLHVYVAEPKWGGFFGWRTSPHVQVWDYAHLPIWGRSREWRTLDAGEDVTWGEIRKSVALHKIDTQRIYEEMMVYYFLKAFKRW